MNKTLLVTGREYFTRVKKKSFLLTTILVPVVIIGFYMVIVALTLKGSDSRQSVAVIDKAELFTDKPDVNSNQLEFVFINNETEASFISKYKSQGYDAFLYIPEFHLDSPRNFVLHSPSPLGLSATFQVEDVVNNAVIQKRLKAQGIDPENYKKIQSSVSIQNTIDTKSGSKRGMAGVAMAVSFACGILIYMMMIIYGTQVMRGVMEEKTNRIAEVMVSSVKPFQLMMGKILGIGAVGLTQFAIWIILLLLAQLALPLFFPDITSTITSAASEGVEISKAASIMEGLHALPLGKIIFLFLFYFLGGYLTYAALFAAIGSVVTDDQQDAQQLIFPVLMPIILGFVIMTNSMNDPNSSISVFGSLFPLTSPIVMMGRITSDLPWWELILSMALLVGCFLFFTWITAKIYRTGILMYGKKPSWKEMMRWAFRRN